MNTAVGAPCGHGMQGTMRIQAGNGLLQGLLHTGVA
jgi:hypothetical protein